MQPKINEFSLPYMCIDIDKREVTEVNVTYIEL